MSPLSRVHSVVSDLLKWKKASNTLFFDCHFKCLYPSLAVNLSVVLILSVSLRLCLCPHPPSAPSVSAAVPGCVRQCDWNEKHSQHRETLLSALPRYWPSPWQQRILDGPRCTGLCDAFREFVSCVFLDREESYNVLRSVMSQSSHGLVLYVIQTWLFETLIMWHNYGSTRFLLKMYSSDA